MAWVKLDDQFFLNRKARAVGPDGRELFVASACYAAMQLNDGCFVTEDLPVIAALAQVPEETAGQLTAHGLWHPEGADCAKCRAVGQTMPVPSGHYSVHEYLKDNPSRDKVLSDREKDRIRKASRSGPESAGESERNPVGNPAAPSRPVPNGDLSSSRPGNSRGTSPPRDDRTDLSTVPDDVWKHYADLKLEAELRAKDIPQSRRTKWKSTTRHNARTEHGGDAERWWHEFKLTPQHLAQCLVDGKPPATHYRRKAQP